MATSNTTITASTPTSAHHPDSACTVENCAGRRLTIDAKINNDMPLPMPRCVTNSPNHISNAVPAVNVATSSATRPAFHTGIKLGVLRLSALPPPCNKKAKLVPCTNEMAMAR